MRTNSLSSKTMNYPTFPLRVFNDDKLPMHENTSTMAVKLLTLQSNAYQDDAT